MEPSYKVKIFVYGNLPFSLNLNKIKKWKSTIFEVTDIKTINDEERIFTNSSQATIDQQEIIDKTLKSIKDNFEFIQHDKLVNINLIVSYVNLGEGWFLYSLKDLGISNTIILSYYDIYNTLITNHIPVENAIISALYTYSLLYLKINSLPTKQEEKECMHLDTRGCLFDFTSQINDIKFYTDCPIVCKYCQSHILEQSELDIKKINKELNKIKKSFFYRLYENIKNNTLIYIVFTFCMSTFITKITSISTYNNKWDIIITAAFGCISLLLLLFVVCSSHYKKKKRYSQNIKSHKTK